MTDLPDRLRALHHEFGQAHDVLIEAADRIDELEVQVAELLLEKIADALEITAELRGPAKDWKMP